MRTRLIQLFALIFILSACDRDTDEQGPNLNDLFGEFKLLEPFEASRLNVNFQNNQAIEFKVLFSKTVDWEIHIIGESSGATKILSGLSNAVDGPNGRWDGTTTQLPMFKKENCIAVLKVENENYADTLTDISIEETRVPQAFVVTDFENGLNSGFNRFVQSGANMRFDTVVSPQSPQGGIFYEFTGNVTFADDLGNIAMPKAAFSDTNFTLNTNPNNVYFNFFARKAPETVNDIIVFQFMEDDNDNGNYDGNDDLYEYVLSGISQEWTLYTVKYSDLVNDAPSGNGIKNPDRLLQIVVLPIGLKEPFSGFVDYLSFTENDTLRP